jgi:asparagine synthetase B (glutamine-hydrolysing)
MGGMIFVNASRWPQTYTAFVCIIYDEELQEIIAVRDHFGLEPCYYNYTNGKLIFGSTIPDVLKHIASPPEINTTQINQLFFNKWFNTETYSDYTVTQFLCGNLTVTLLIIFYRMNQKKYAPNIFLRVNLTLQQHGSRLLLRY